MKLRYEQQALGWWFHDVVVHPISGTIGLVGNLTRSFRLMALAHHLHNGSAPSNDSIADYIEAAGRACSNETADNPSGTRTPDELAWTRKQAQIASGRIGYISDVEADAILRDKGVKSWEGQASGVAAPEFLTREQVEADAEGRRLERQLERAEAALAALLDRRFNHYEIRDMGEEGKEALRRQVETLVRDVQRSRDALNRERRGTSVRDLLEAPK